MDGIRSVVRLAVLGMCLFPALRAVASEPAVGDPPKRTPDSVFVPTPDDIVAKMLEVAGVTKEDVIYDPGCGDGRILITAAKKYGCRGVGIELSPKLVRDARAGAVRNHVERLVRILEEDIYTVDMSEATVVTLYLLPGMNVKLIPQLQKLKPGADRGARLRVPRPRRGSRKNDHHQIQRGCGRALHSPLDRTAEGENAGGLIAASVRQTVKMRASCAHFV